MGADERRQLPQPEDSSEEFTPQYYASHRQTLFPRILGLIAKRARFEIETLIVDRKPEFVSKMFEVLPGFQSDWFLRHDYQTMCVFIIRPIRVLHQLRQPFSDGTPNGALSLDLEERIVRSMENDQVDAPPLFRTDGVWPVLSDHVLVESVLNLVVPQRGGPSGSLRCHLRLTLDALCVTGPEHEFG